MSASDKLPELRLAPVESADESVVRLGGVFAGSLVSMLNVARIEFVPVTPELEPRLEAGGTTVLVGGGTIVLAGDGRFGMASGGTAPPGFPRRPPRRSDWRPR